MVSAVPHLVRLQGLRVPWLLGLQFFALVGCVPFFHLVQRRGWVARLRLYCHPLLDRILVIVTMHQPFRLACWGGDVSQSHILTVLIPLGPPSLIFFAASSNILG